MSSTVKALLAALVVTAALAPRAARADERVALAPLSTLGAESRGNRTDRLTEQLAAGIASIGAFQVVPERELLAAVKRADRPGLRTCEGSVACLAELGALVQARYVVHGELGGLGDAEVLALRLVDAAQGREIRSTTAQFGDGRRPDREEARAAAFRLLAPHRYTGQIALEVDVPGATIYVDGTQVATSPSPPIRAEVGNHALRITHPEYRDFVRFIDVPFDASVALAVPLQAYPIVDREVKQRGGVSVPLAPTPQHPGGRPWYRRWYTVAGAGAVLFVSAAIAAGLAADGIDRDLEHQVDP